MSIAFPPSPSLDDVFGHSGKVWVWDGTIWRIAREANDHTDTGTMTLARGGTGETTSLGITDALELPWNVLVSPTTNGTGTTLDIDLTGFTAYDLIWIKVRDWQQDTAASVYARWSYDGGSTFRATAGDYEYLRHTAQSSTTVNKFNSSTSDARDTLADIGGFVSIDADGNAHLDAYIFNPHSTTITTQCWVNMQFMGDSGTDTMQSSANWFRQASQDDITDFRFYPSAGNIDGGWYAVYGLRGT